MLFLTRYGKGERCMNHIDQARKLLLVAAKDMKAMELMLLPEMRYTVFMPSRRLKSHSKPG